MALSSNSVPVRERRLRSTTSPTATIPASNAMTIPMATGLSLLAPNELVPVPSLVVLIGAERVTPPVPLLDLLDFLFAEPEVVADFVNEGLADGSATATM